MNWKSFLGTVVFACVATFARAELASNPQPLRDHSLPAKPIFTKVAATSLFEIDLTWRDKSTNEDGFQIERSTDKINFHQIAQVLPGTTIYRDKNLFPGKRYYYRIRAFGGSGISGNSTASARTPSPARPLTIVTWGNQIAKGTNAPDVVSIAEGDYAVLALHKDGTVTAANDFFHRAQPPTNLTDVAAISAGSDHYLALKSDGNVVEWGSFSSGFEKPMPTNLTGVVAISVGDQHCLALKGDGTVVGWGVDIYSQATPPLGLSGVVAIAAGGEYSLALKSDGSVVQWGYNLYPPPTNLPPAVAIAAGYHHSFVIDTNGAVIAWGSSYAGAAIPPTNLTGVVSIAAGSTHTEALKKDGTIVSWGNVGMPYDLYRKPDLGGGAVAVSTLRYETAALSLSPASPSLLQAKVLTPRRTELSWQDNSTGESGFQLERCIDGPTLVWKRIANLGQGVTNFIDIGLAPNVIYRYRVRALNPLGASPYSGAIAVITETLAAPQLFGPTFGSNDVIVTWSDTLFGIFSEPAPFSGMDGFKIERAPDINGVPGPWTEIGAVPAAAKPFSYSVNPYIFHDTNAAPNLTYWYRVRAFNTLDVSDYSGPVSISLVAPFVPQSFTVQVVADQARLFWASYQTSAQGFKIEHAPDVSGTPGVWTEITNVDVTAGSYTDSGLSVNSKWWYRLRAFNWVGDSPYTDPISVTILPPAAPTFGSISLGATNTVQLIWYEHLAEPDGFKLERAPDVDGQPGDWTQIHVSNSGDENPNLFYDTNVVANATYWYRVKAFNILGESDYSARASFSIVPPMAPSLSVSAYRDQIGLGWSFDGIGLAGFKIERAPDLAGSPGQWTQIALLPAVTFTPHSYNDTGRSPDTTYWYRVRAFNWVGDSPYSEQLSATIVPPAMPSDLQAFIGDTNQVNLFWWGSPDDDEFYVESAPDSGGAPGPWKQIATVPVWTHSYQLNYYADTNAIANTTNWYRVRAYSVVGVSSYCTPTTVAIIPPGIPTLAAYPQANRASLDWSEDSDSDNAIASYVIQRAPDINGSPGAWTQIAAPTTGIHNLVDPNGTAGLTAWYRIRAATWVGVSPFCDPIAVTFTPPYSPSAPVGQLGATNQLVLFWTDNSQDEDGFVIERAPEANGLPGLWTQLGTIFSTNAFDVQFTDTNTLANTTNWYRVRAFTGNDVSAYSRPTQIGILPPAAPYLSGYSAAAGPVYLSWWAPDFYSAAIAGVKIERAPDTNGSPWMALTNTTGFDYTDWSVVPGSTYWYRVRAYNWVGDSTYSDPISVAVPAPEVQVPLTVIARPAHLLSVTLTNGGALLQWSTTGSGADMVQAANDFAGNYTDLSPALTIEGTGTVVTNYFDAGALTNASRFYRIRSSR
jgi:hypothetical protein